MAVRILISVLHFLRNTNNFKTVISTSNKLDEKFFRTTETPEVWIQHSKSTIHFCDGVERNKNIYIKQKQL
jgi:hypothetical protein